MVVVVVVGKEEAVEIEAGRGVVVEVVAKPQDSWPSEGMPGTGLPG